MNITNSKCLYAPSHVMQFLYMLTFNKIKEKGEEIKIIINQNVLPDNIHMTDTASIIGLLQNMI